MARHPAAGSVGSTLVLTSVKLLCLLMVVTPTSSMKSQWGMLKSAEQKVLASFIAARDHVRILQKTSDVDDMLREPNDVDMILFYAHWCSHCQKFAPRYQQFAVDVKGLFHNV